ncbi:MAG: hypothetical protein ACKOGA_08655, partial [Planctomycetaceae bacterium]
MRATLAERCLESVSRRRPVSSVTVDCLIGWFRWVVSLAMVTGDCRWSCLPQAVLFPVCHFPEF